MAILQIGVGKSGNLWLYKILQELLHRSGQPLQSYIRQHPIQERARTWELSFAGQAEVDWITIKPRGCYCRISSLFREPITDFDSYVRQCSHVWTHSPVNRRSFQVLPKFEKIVYIIRDPRDVANSLARYAFTKHVQEHFPPHYEKDPASFRALTLDGVLRNWVQHVGGYLRHREEFGLHVVFYERLLRDFDHELTGLTDYLGLALDGEARRKIQEAVDFASMRKENPGHVAQGRAGTWQETFSSDQKELAERIAGPMLRLLNNPNPTRTAIDEAIAPARRSWCDEIERVAVFVRSQRPVKAKLARIRELLK